MTSTAEHEYRWRYLDGSWSKWIRLGETFPFYRTPCTRVTECVRRPVPGTKPQFQTFTEQPGEVEARLRAARRQEHNERVLSSAKPSEPAQNGGAFSFDPSTLDQIQQVFTAAVKEAIKDKKDNPEF